MVPASRCSEGPLAGGRLRRGSCPGCDGLTRRRCPEARLPAGTGHTQPHTDLCQPPAAPGVTRSWIWRCVRRPALKHSLSSPGPPSLCGSVLRARRSLPNTHPKCSGLGGWFTAALPTLLQGATHPFHERSRGRASVSVPALPRRPPAPPQAPPAAPPPLRAALWLRGGAGRQLLGRQRGRHGAPRPGRAAPGVPPAGGTDPRPPRARRGRAGPTRAGAVAALASLLRFLLWASQTCIREP